MPATAAVTYAMTGIVTYAMTGIVTYAMTGIVTYAMTGIVVGTTTHSQFWLMFKHAIVSLGIHSVREVRGLQCIRQDGGGELDQYMLTLVQSLSIDEIDTN